MKTAVLLNTRASMSGFIFLPVLKWREFNPVFTVHLAGIPYISYIETEEQYFNQSTGHME